MSDFRKRMGLDGESVETLKQRFLNRVNVALFRWIEDAEGIKFFDENFIWWISTQLGEGWGRYVKQNEHMGNYYSNLTLQQMAAGDFTKTLEIIEKLREYLEQGLAQEIYGRYYHDPAKTVNLRLFDRKMEGIMLLSGSKIGVFWNDGKFYPAGAKELDAALISDPLDWLEKYPRTRAQFLTALKHYEASTTDPSTRKDAITNAYTAMECLAQEHLSNNRNFDKNSNDLVEKIGLPSEYKNIVHYYKLIANEYSSRHAGSEVSLAEVEAFIYLTGLLLRLVSHV